MLMTLAEGLLESVKHAYNCKCMHEDGIPSGHNHCVVTSKGIAREMCSHQFRCYLSHNTLHLPSLQRVHSVHFDWSDSIYTQANLHTHRKVVWGSSLGVTATNGLGNRNPTKLL